MLSAYTALERILRTVAEVAPLPPERVPLSLSLGRALAEEVRAERALPPFHASRMDGYALRASDARRPGARLPVALEVFAGDPPGRALPRGACARIFTGAPVPEGADCVEMQEEVVRRGDRALFRRAASRGRFIRATGSDVSLGSVVLERGGVVDPGSIGLAAALGRTELSVYRRPRAGIVATGDEIVPVDRPPGPGGIADSNSHALAAACVDAGAVPILLPLARDDRGSLRRALAAARGLDALVTAGGISVGERDLVRKALAGAGGRVDFAGVAVSPGRPFAFGRWGKTLFFGLPGNPFSTLVAFELFARPALRALQGLAGSGRPEILARLGAAEDKPAGDTIYRRCRLRPSRGLPVAERCGTESGNVSAMAGLEALAVLPAGVARLRRGTTIRVLLVGAPIRSVRPDGGSIMIGR
ncbi:MAG TPA: gephyrin-like molybdotransferase Glp [Anaeromyxobacteraceae bacterium]|nr:gephyrin-like molybdotransferase Glp [Anaeromyxobacteraceae bacterium]